MWWRKLLHRTHIKPDGWLIVQAYTEHENRAIDIYNSWNFGVLDRHDALESFTDEMLRDPGAKMWHKMIWRSDDLTQKK